VGLTLAVTAVIYFQTLKFEFTNYDDPYYIYDNPLMVQSWGEKLKAAFTSVPFASWIPITWVTYFVDYSFSGMDPWGYHFTNMLFHAANCILLFFVLKRYTGAIFPSAFVVLIFAAHPLHVESVAWVSSRKDLVSLFFGLCMLWSYRTYTEKDQSKDLYLALLFLGLSLMSKPMMVTMPFVLLLLDIWPLNRISLSGSTKEWSKSLFVLAKEKWAFFVLTIVFCIVTVVSQTNSGAIKYGAVFTIGERITNALTAYVGYLFHTVWPVGLIPFYPHRGTGIPIWSVLISALILLGISVIVYRFRTAKPYLLVGWFWFLGTLVPVIGLVQVGRQAMADRYTYLPHIGLLLMVCWLAWEWANTDSRRKAVGSIGGVLVLILTVLSFNQTSRWKDSITLFEYTLEVSPDNAISHNNLGAAYLDVGFIEQSIIHTERSLEIEDDVPNRWKNLGNAYFHAEQYDKAVDAVKKAIDLDSRGAKYPNLLAKIYLEQNKMDEAREWITNALEADPESLDAKANLGMLYIRKQEFGPAEELYREVLEVNPNHVDALGNLGTLLSMSKEPDFKQIRALFMRALSIKPDNATMWVNLAFVEANLGNGNDAVKYCRRAISIDPSNTKAKRLLNDLQGRR
jgi:tetratricopeptide (TPR) repeat protein